MLHDIRDSSMLVMWPRSRLNAESVAKGWAQCSSKAHQCQCFYWEHNAQIRSVVCMIVMLIICVCTDVVCLIHSSILINASDHGSECFITKDWSSFFYQGHVVTCKQTNQQCKTGDLWSASCDGGVRATPSYIPKWASCGFYKKPGLGEVWCDCVIVIRYDQEW